MTRIIAGRARGRRLDVPRGLSTRPTTDRVREALFSSLESELGAFTGMRVLDLFAGSGALGLEALSRGASHVQLIESDKKAVETIQRNIASVDLPAAVVTLGTVATVLSAEPADRFDVVFADPPYALAGALVTELLGTLVSNGWLAPDAIVVVERSARAEALQWPPGLAAGRQKRYGETMLWYGHSAGRIGR